MKESEVIQDKHAYLVIVPRSQPFHGWEFEEFNGFSPAPSFLQPKAKWSAWAGCCCYSVTQSCLTLCDPMDCSMPNHLPEFAQTHIHWVGDAIQSSHPLSPLLLLPSVFPSIRVFSYESYLQDRPKYWSFRFSISPSIDYSGLISLLSKALSRGEDYLEER